MLDLIVTSLPLLYFLNIAAVTPGPNNVMLTASGINFGYKRTIPHMLGILVGFNVLIILGALGVGTLYESLPQIEIVLKVLGSLYLLYLSYKIFNAGRIGLDEKTKNAEKPMTFVEAFLFQFVNPKGVVFAMAAASVLPTSFTLLESVIAVSICSAIASLISTNVWAVFGTLIAELFRDAKKRFIVNTAMALLLVATIPMMIF